MKKETFIEQALSEISNDPLSRVSENIQAIKADAIYDVHCHIFDLGCMPTGYFVLRFLTYHFVNDFDHKSQDEEAKLRSSDISLVYRKEGSVVGITEEELYQRLEKNDDLTLKKVENDIAEAIEEEEKEVEKSELRKEAFLKQKTKKLGEKKALDFVFQKALLLEEQKIEKRNKRIRDFKFLLRMIFRYKTNKEVFEEYLNSFAVKNHEGFAGRPFLTAAIMMDTQPGWNFKHQEKSITEQIADLLSVTAEYANSQTPILPFFAVDPRRADEEKENLYDLFLKAFPKEGTSFFGVKIYPCLGYLPSDHRLEPIFRICEEKNIPVLTHCGASLVSTFERQTGKKLVLTENFDPNDKVEIEFSERRKMGDFLNQPEHWRPVLQKFPKLKLNIAHFGSAVPWNGSAPKETLAESWNKVEYKSFDKSKRKNTIIKLMQDFKGVYSDFSYNITEEDTFINLLNELDLQGITKERTMFGTDFWVVFANTVLAKKKLNELQEDFIACITNHKQGLFTQIPHQYLFQ